MAVMYGHMAYMQDNDGFEYEYSTTDLDDALALRNTKTIKEY